MSGKLCEACGHEHTGRQWAYICIGCACPETPGKPTGVVAIVEAHTEGEPWPSRKKAT